MFCAFDLTSSQSLPSVLIGTFTHLSALSISFPQGLRSCHVLFPLMLPVRCFKFGKSPLFPEVLWLGYPCPQSGLPRDRTCHTSRHASCRRCLLQSAGLWRSLFLVEPEGLAGVGINWFGASETDFKYSHLFLLTFGEMRLFISVIVFLLSVVNIFVAWWFVFIF